MILINHPLFNDDKLYTVENIASIKKSPSNSVLIINDIQNQELINYACKNQLDFALYASNLTEAIYANKFGAKYILINKKEVKAVQKLADTYLFDAKILVLINSENEIETLAQEEVDGCIFL